MNFQLKPRLVWSLRSALSWRLNQEKGTEQNQNAAKGYDHWCVLYFKMYHTLLRYLGIGKGGGEESV